MKHIDLILGASLPCSLPFIWQLLFQEQRCHTIKRIPNIGRHSAVSDLQDLTSSQIPQNKTMALSKQQNGASITIIAATTQTNTIKPTGSSKENQTKKVEHLLITDKLK